MADTHTAHQHPPDLRIETTPHTPYACALPRMAAHALPARGRSTSVDGRKTATEFAASVQREEA